MPYYLILALQAFCIYHSVKNRNAYYWIFIILFVPLLGSIIYILTQVFNKNDVDKLHNEITTIVNPTKKIKDLEKRLEFSETFQNRVNLADAYFETMNYQEAIKHYQASLKGNFENDFHVVKQLVLCTYNVGDYKSAIEYSERIKANQMFETSEAQFFYGLALEKEERFEEAETELRKIDKRYSNYNERLAFAKFLLSRNKDSEAKEVLNEIYIESQHINRDNGRKFRAVFKEAEQLLKNM